MKNNIMDNEQRTTDYGRRPRGFVCFVVVMIMCVMLGGKAWGQDIHIPTDIVWATFCFNMTSNTDNYEGKTIYLDEDISTSLMAGTSSCPFKGTFDGQGHTITVSYTATDGNYTAPFRCIDGATIKNLVTAGTINMGGYKFGAGLAGDCYGSNTITNCVSNVTINSTVNGDGTHGGFIARIQGGTTTFNGCAFTGELNGSNTRNCGGFVGWDESDNGAYVRINNSLFAPSQLEMSGTNSATFSRYRSSNNVTVTNSYYTQSFGTEQGKLAYTVTGEGGVTVALRGSSTEYNVSGITAYSTGIVYNGTVYGGSGDELALNLGYNEPYILNSYSADHGTLNGSALTGANDEYTLTMVASNTVITATHGDLKNHIASSISTTQMTWAQFVSCVNGGISFSGNTVYLDEDIDVNQMVGTPEHSFIGTFDGQGYEIDFGEYTHNSPGGASPIGLFTYVRGDVTIQNLKVEGTINAQTKMAAGFIGDAYPGGTINIVNCVSNVIINSTVNGDGTHGAFVARKYADNSNSPSCILNIEGCIFTGKMLGSNTSHCGGFVGWCEGNSGNTTITNSLFCPEEMTILTSNGCTFARARNINLITIDNCYYITTNDMATVQGKHAYTVTGESGVSVAMRGDRTQYNVSGIDAYGNGIVYNSNIYGGDGDNLALSLSYNGSDLLTSYVADHGTLSGTDISCVNDPYTLAMPGQAVIINHKRCDIDPNPDLIIWKGGTSGALVNWNTATNWTIYNSGESKYQPAGSAPSESSNVLLISNENCEITRTPTLSLDGVCNDITLLGIGVNIDEGKNLTVNGTATFNNGIIAGDVIFGNSANSAGVCLDSHVDGLVTKSGSANGFIFPTGNNGNLGTVEATSNIENVSVQYFSNPSGFGTNDLPRWWNMADMCGENPFNHVSNVEYWKISSSALMTATFTASAGSDVHFNEDTGNRNPDNINMAFYASNCWKNVGGTANINGNTITITDATIPQSTRTISGNYITLGSKSAATLLPIELSTFIATCDGRSALVEWTTATEKNNDYFSLERSDDAVNFVEVSRVAGAGNSIEPLDYSYTDYDIHAGNNYYRLVQVDYDGSRTASEIVLATCAETAEDDPEVLAFPNPFSGELTVMLDNFGNRPARIEVYDMLGKLIYTDKVASPQNYYETVLNLSNLPPATYTIRVSTADFVINRKVVKQ